VRAVTAAGSNNPPTPQNPQVPQKQRDAEGRCFVADFCCNLLRIAIALLRIAIGTETGGQENPE
jgi:hypothetical protein